MKSKFVFSSTFANDFSVKTKARLVACGYSQIKDIDYTELFAPTINLGVVLLMLTIGVNMGSHISNWDIGAAFLEGTNRQEQFCFLPPELGGGTGKQGRRVRLLKSLYGQKDAPLNWYKRLVDVLMLMGFQRSEMDLCLFTRTRGNEYIHLGTHVDDGLMITTSVAVTEGFLVELQSHLKKVTQFELQRYIGMNMITCDDGSLHLSHEQYIDDMDLYPVDSTPKIPMNSNVNLRKCH